MRSAILAAAVAAVLAVAACSSPASKGATASGVPAATHTAAQLTVLQACRMLHADEQQNGGQYDAPTLNRIAQRLSDLSAAAVRLAAEIQSARDDVGSNSPSAQVDRAVLAHECSRVGVVLPS